MSRTPVREALIKLEAEGLIELVPRHGARVLPLRPDDMAEIYEILTSLEPAAAARLAERSLTAHDLAPLEDATCHMEEALHAEDMEAWAEADDRFHRTLLQIHGNQRLSDFVSALLDQSHRARMVTLQMRQPPVQSTKEHREILKHIASGNPEAARQAFQHHRTRAADELLQILKTFRLGQL